MQQEIDSSITIFLRTIYIHLQSKHFLKIWCAIKVYSSGGTVAQSASNEYLIVEPLVSYLARSHFSCGSARRRRRLAYGKAVYVYGENVERNCARTAVTFPFGCRPHK